MQPSAPYRTRAFAVAAAGYVVMVVLAALAWGDAVSVLGMPLADVLYHPPLVVVVAVMLRALLARRIAHRRFWLLLAPAVILLVCGDVTWTAIEAAGADPTPSPADACYVIGTLLIAIAMARGLRTWSWLGSVRALLDAGVLAVAVVAVAAQLVLVPQLGWGLDGSVVLAPCCDRRGAARRRRRRRDGWRLLPAGRRRDRRGAAARGRAHP